MSNCFLCQLIFSYWKPWRNLKKQYRGPVIYGPVVNLGQSALGRSFASIFCRCLTMATKFWNKVAGSVSRRFLIASSLQFDVNKLAEKLTVQQLLDDDAETADADSAAFGPLVPLGRWLSIVSSHKLPPKKRILASLHAPHHCPHSGEYLLKIKSADNRCKAERSFK